MGRRLADMTILGFIGPRCVVEVCCKCGYRHELISGFDAPIYWCGDSLCILKEGDEVLIDD